MGRKPDFSFAHINSELVTSVNQHICGLNWHCLFFGFEFYRQQWPFPFRIISQFFLYGLPPFNIISIIKDKPDALNGCAC